MAYKQKMPLGKLDPNIMTFGLVRLISIPIVGFLLVVHLNGCTDRVASVEMAANRIKHLKLIADELWSVPQFLSLTPDHSGKNVAYIRVGDKGRQLVVLNLKEKREAVVNITNEVSKVFDWSPDDRYFAFTEIAEPLLEIAKTNGSFQKEAWLCLFDSERTSVERVTTNSACVEGAFAWLGSRKCFYSVKAINNGFTQKFVCDLEKQTHEQVFNYVSDFVLISSNTAAFVQKGNISKCQIDRHEYPVIERVTAFGMEDFDIIRWLRYSRATGNYLFCARPQNSNWRFLYELDPRTQTLQQLTHEDTYNGQCLDRNNGFAYISNTNNSFHLAIRRRGENTNLFLSGSVLNFSVAPNGEELYVTAATGIEPHGVWRYSCRSNELVCVSPGDRTPFKHVSLARPVEFTHNAEDGIPIPYYVLKPADKAPAWSNSKHPVIVYLPPSSGQFQRGFDMQSQLFANLGFYYLVINYRGCDGYGRDYANLSDIQAAARDVKAILTELLNDKKVDQHNIFIASASSGSTVVEELVRNDQANWRGVILDHPAGWNYRPQVNSVKMPPLLFITGDQDRFFPSVHAFVAWGQTNGVKAKLIVQKNTGHYNWKMAEAKVVAKRMASFCLDLTDQ